MRLLLLAVAAATALVTVSASHARTGPGAWQHGDAPPGTVEGYLSTQSAAPGEQVGLHVSIGGGGRYRVELFRIGWYDGVRSRLVLCLPACDADEAAVEQPTPARDPVTQEARADWPVTDTIAVGADWASGYYLAEVVLTTGPAAGTAYKIPLIVRAPRSAPPSRALVIAPINTWEAYNNWGGASTYPFNSVAVATKVSFDRPGLTDRSGLQYEIPLALFLDRYGYDVSYATDADVDAHPSEFLRHRLVIVAGHSEYWTNAMRRGLGDAIEQGTNVAFMGANYAYWQVRYEDGGRTMVAYKETGGDPIGNPELVTTRFRNFGQPLRECDLGGVQWWGGSWNIPPADLVVNDTLLGDRWFRGTRIGKGTRLRGVVGGRADTTYGEWDGVVPGCAQGPVSVFFHFDGGPFRKPGADTVRSIAPSGAVVFSSGTHRFSWTLESSVYDRGYASPGMRRFMRNALGDLMRAAPPAVVSVSADRRGASVSVDDPIDPRIVRLSVFARTGQGPWKPYCSGRPPECSGPPLQAGTYRFAAVLGDRWGRSRPLVSEPVVVTGG